MKDERSIVDLFAERIVKRSLKKRAWSERFGLPEDEGVHELFMSSTYKYDDVDEIKKILDRGIDVNVQDKHGNTPLHEAALNNCINIVKFLLDRGADPNIQNDGGWTPLHYAALFGRKDVIELLLDHGADPDIKNKDGKTYEDVLRIHERNVEIMSDRVKIKRLTRTARQLIDALRGEEVTKAIELAQQVEDVNAQDDEGFSLLHWAVMGENEEVEKILLDRGADPNIQSLESKETPLHIVTGGTRIDPSLAKPLLDHGADPNMQDAWGATPLHYAASQGSRYLVKLLLEYGADPDIKNRRGETPRDVAEKRDYIDIINLLETRRLKNER